MWERDGGVTKVSIITADHHDFVLELMIGNQP